ncbi:MAG: cupin domain-containing protein [Gaiellales bacterium]
MPFVEESPQPAFGSGGNRLVGLPAPSTGSDHLLVYRAVLGAGQATSRHSHDRDEVITVLAGRLTVLLGDEERTLGSGSCAIVPAGTPHQARNDSDAPCDSLIATSSDVRYFNKTGAETPAPPWTR